MFTRFSNPIVSLLHSRLARVIVILATIGALHVLGLPEYTHAQVTVRTGQEVSLNKDQVVNGNFYASSDIITVSGEVLGDASLVAYRSITINGIVNRDVLVAGSEVRLFGAIGEDVRVVAGEVTIADRVEGDVLVLGGSLEILSTASIGGDVLFYGGSLQIAGAVEGTVLGRMQTIRIDGPIGGDVQIRADTVTLGDRAAITGTLQYTSPQPLLRAANATTGEVRRTEPSYTTLALTPQQFLVPLLISLFSVLLWHLGARRVLHTVMNTAIERPSQVALIGLATLFFGLPIAVLMIATIIGSLVGVWLLFAWLTLVVTSCIVAGPILGHWLSRTAGYGNTWPMVWHMLLGTVLLHMLRVVPVLGMVLIVIIVLIALGTVIKLSYRAIISPSNSVVST